MRPGSTLLDSSSILIGKRQWIWFCTGAWLWTEHVPSKACPFAKGTVNHITYLMVWDVLKNPLLEAIRLNRLCWFGHVQRMEENRIPKGVLYMNQGTTWLRGRPRNRWQDDVREDGRIGGGEGWQEKVHNREEWKKLLRMARNHCILHMPMEWINGLGCDTTQFSRYI